MTAKAPAYRLLIAEDDREIATLLQRYFQTRNVEVTLAADGEVARQEFLARPFDVVLTDLMMPRVSGRELVLQIHGHITRGRTPVVIMTATVQTDRDEEALARELRVDAVFRKPLPLRDLAARLEAIAARAPAAPAATASSSTSSSSSPPSSPPSPSPSLAAVATAVARMPRQAQAVDEPVPPSSGPALLPALAAWLRHVFERRLCGVLQLYGADGPRAVFIDDGLIVDVASGVASESLEHILVAHNVVSATELLALPPGQLLVRAVVQRQGVPAYRVVHALELQARKVLDATLSSTAGAFRWAANPSQPLLDARMRLDPMEMVQRAAFHANLDTIMGWLRALIRKRLVAGDAFNERVLVFARLRPDSVVPMSLMEPQTVSAAVQKAQVLGPDALRDLAALIMSGCVEVMEGEGATPERRAVTLASTLLQPWDTHEPTALQQRESIAMEWVRTMGLDAYTLLGVEPAAPWIEVETALRVLDSRLGPALDQADLGPAKSYLTLMRARRDEVRRLLGNPAQRQVYDAGLLVRRRMAENLA